ncbi:CLUMA_CG011845, isoform A [Clunio marinus]|uniref:CLUMA_CG011845, isoform A n=1 Tax=Clunio marinus TaxID=568069 RepID=A0A1J1IE50_9DIPT|nr:CLUMA_CG011845, isoform A [Clunio marinus]
MEQQQQQALWNIFIAKKGKNASQKERKVQLGNENTRCEYEISMSDEVSVSYDDFAEIRKSMRRQCKKATAFS